MYPARIEIRVRNNVLYRAIFGKYRSVKAFCDEEGFRDTGVGALLNLKESPKTKDGNYRKICKALTSVVRIPEEDLFPDALYKIPNPEASIAVPVSVLIKEERALLADPHILALRSELGDKLGEVLDRLTGNEPDILRMRFGIGDYVPATLKEVSNKYGLTRERVRQIERRGLRRIREDQRSELLRDYVEAI